MKEKKIDEREEMPHRRKSGKKEYILEKRYIEQGSGSEFFARVFSRDWKTWSKYETEDGMRKAAESHSKKYGWQFRMVFPDGRIEPVLTPA